MATGAAPVKADNWEFDLYQISGWVQSHPGLAALILFVAYVFWISRRDGLIGLLIEDRRSKRELKAKVESDRENLLLRYKKGNSTPLSFSPQASLKPRAKRTARSRRKGR